MIALERRVRELRGRVARGPSIERVGKLLADKERVVRWVVERDVEIVFREFDARERVCSVGKVEVRVVI